VSNLVAYSAQVALVAAGGTLLLMLLRVHAPAVRYAYWRALLALCLALPWIQGRQMQAPEQLVVDVSVGAADAAGVAAATAAPSMSLPDWSALVLWTIAGGASLRLLWMAVSLYRLRRLRMAGAPGADPQERELQDTIGITARIRYADEIAQPVTFGLRQPVVLLPSSLRDGDPGIRRAGNKAVRPVCTGADRLLGDVVSRFVSRTHWANDLVSSRFRREAGRGGRRKRSPRAR
jgi:beta-lactamase regulating signal transducer with metallopeptidase domain